MEQLPSTKARQAFSGHWGRIFEKYVQELVHHCSGDAMLNAVFPGGDIDIFIEVQDIAIIVEIKAGFLAQNVKNARNQELLAAELRRKYVVNSKGQPKGVRQLANAARALRENAVAASTQVCARIYPVLVVEDPAMQTAGMNAYLNELFELEITRDQDIAPLSLLLVDELEEVLPHILAKDLSWRQLFDHRVIYGKVVAPHAHKLRRACR